MLLQARLGCRGGPAFSLEAACSGFIYALAVADKFVRAGEAQAARWWWAPRCCRGSPTTTIAAPRSCSAMAPAPWCCSPPSEPGIISTHLHADGSYKHLLYCTGGPARGAAPGTMAPGDFVRMAGSEVFKLAVTLLGRVGR